MVFLGVFRKRTLTMSLIAHSLLHDAPYSSRSGAIRESDSKFPKCTRYLNDTNWASKRTLHDSSPPYPERCSARRACLERIEAGGGNGAGKTRRQVENLIRSSRQPDVASWQPSASARSTDQHQSPTTFTISQHSETDRLTDTYCSRFRRVCRSIAGQR